MYILEARYHQLDFSDLLHNRWSLWHVFADIIILILLIAIPLIEMQSCNLVSVVSLLYVAYAEDPGKPDIRRVVFCYEKNSTSDLQSYFCKGGKWSCQG